MTLAPGMGLCMDAGSFLGTGMLSHHMGYWWLGGRGVDGAGS
jgi:hypothetical protein